MTDAVASSSSSPVKAPRSPKQAKAPKPAKESAQTASPSPNDSKGKSAKELKKEKRAAAVAARVTDQPQSGPSDSSGTRRPNAGTPAVSSAAVPTMGAHLKRPGNISQPSHIQTPSTSQNLFFSHLPVHNPPNTPAAFNTSKLHPDIIRLGVLMSEGTLRGANARTMAMMAAFQEVIQDYECPDQAVLWKDLPIYLSPMIAWLEGCRPKGVGGGNAIRWLKSEINRLGEESEVKELTDAESKSYLIDAIGVYLRDRIEFADKVISDHAQEKIRPGETVVVYARSSVVERTLIDAWRKMQQRDPNAKFDVIVVDSRPLNEGKALLHSLVAAGLSCTYILLPLLASILSRASLVLLGASALHSDGALYSRAGTAVVAMLAKEHRVPVVACVETYKFGERVVLDGVASNELGDGDVLATIGTNKAVGIKEPLAANLTPLSLMYDLTPPSLITAVCTEIGFIPPSSVPTVLGKASGVV